MSNPPALDKPCLKPAPIAAPLFELAGAAVKSAIRNPQSAIRRPAIEIQSGSSIVKIFTGPRGKGPFTIAWREGAGGARRRLKRSDLAKAKTIAKEKADALANGELWRATMDEKNVATFKRSLELLHPTGKPMELACAEIAEAYAILRAAGLADSIADAARFLVEHRSRANIVHKSCPDVLTEMLLARKRDGAFKNTLDDYRSRLGRFTKHFQGPIMEVSGKQINDWLRTLTRVNKKGIELLPRQYITKRTRNNYRDAIREFYRFAIEVEYVPKDWKVFGDVKRVKNEPVVVRIYTPEQMQALLEAALDNLVPFMAIGAFGRVRSEEMAPDDPTLPRLDWREINFETREIRVLPEVARKIGEDRIIPMDDNLVAWLKPHARHSGPICELRNVPNALARTARRAGVKLLDNGLRRSSLSYRLAMTNNIEQVAKEGGTSPERIRINYKVTVPEREGKRWSNIFPTKQMPLQLFG